MATKAKAKASTREVECLVNNVWTSRGKMHFGDKVELPADEADQVEATIREILKAKAK